MRFRQLAPIFILAAARSTVACSGGCPTLEACDIRDASCQEHTREVLACLRGGDTASVSVEVVDAQAFVESRVQESTAEPETPGERDLRRALAIFELLPASDEAGQSVRDYWSRIAAFYSSDTHGITVLDWGRPLDGPLYAGLLLHEMVHAMQRADSGLDDEQHYSSYDEALAFRGMIEGEATLYQDLSILEGYGRDTEATDFSGIFGQFREREWRRARGDGSPYEFARLRFSYSFGGGYVNQAWRAGNNGAVRDLFADPPQSSRQILAGYGAVALREDPNDVGKPVLSGEFEHVATLHLGTWLFEIYRDLFSTGPGFSRGFSDSGFAGDVLTVFRQPASGAVVAFWRQRFGNADQAAAVNASLRSDPFLITLLDGRDLIVAGDTGQAPTAAFVEALAWEAATPEDWQEAPPAASGPNHNGLVACPLAEAHEQ